MKKHSDSKNMSSRPIFFDIGGRRWQRTLKVTCVASLALGLFAVWMLQSLFWSLWPAQEHNGSGFPRSVVYDSGDTIPSIGEGFLTRIDEVRRENGKLLLTDPFSAKIFREATEDEVSDIGSHVYVRESFGTIPDHTLVLTFDDGPDPSYTPQLLDLLSKNHIQAVFFSIGTKTFFTMKMFSDV